MTSKSFLKRGFRFFLRPVLSIALLGALAYSIGSAEIVSGMQTVRWDFLALVVAILASHVLFVTPRWASILSSLGYPLHSSSLIGSVFTGFLFNQVLPTGVGGDAFRVWRANQLGVPLEVGIHSVLLDRAAGVLVVLAGTAILLPFARSDVRATLLLPVGILMAGCICLSMALWSFGALQSVALSVLVRVQVIVAEFNASVRLLIRRPGMMLLILGLSAIGQLIVVAAIGFLAVAMNIDISLLDLTIISFGATLAGTIPISIAGWGLREGAVVFLFSLYGVPAGTAFTVSILFGASLLIASAPGALTLLRAGRTRPV
jgi:uncharacterized protein (TIRG00374 family)